MSSKAESFSLTWVIENFSLFLAEKDGCLKSPCQKTEINGRNVVLVLSARSSFSSVKFRLSALKSDVPIDIVKLSLISSCGEIPLFDKISNQLFSIEYDKILGDNGQSLFPNDIFTVRCRMWAKAMKPEEYSIHSVLHKVQLSWNIKNFHESLTHKKVELFEKESLQFEMNLLRIMDAEPVTHILKLEVKDDWTFFIRIKPLNACFAVAFEEYNELHTSCRSGIRIKTVNYTDINLSIECFVALNKSSPVKLPCHFSSDRENVSQECLVPSNTLGNDLLLLYRESRHSDITINTKGRSLAAHKNILSARSSVFRAMFEKDQMSEGQSGVVNIEDIDGDTMDRVLVFLYSNSLEDMNWKEAVELYYAADKYDVLALKLKCAGILKDQLATDNVCDILVLADSHSDEKLMVCVMDFISGNREVISAAAWKELEENNSRLTTKVLREVLMKKI